MAGPCTAQIRLLLAPSSPEALAAWICRYLDALRVQHRSVSSIRTRRSKLAQFNAWCVERGLERPDQITHATMLRYQSYLFGYRKADGHPLAVNGQRHALVLVHIFFRWLVRQRVLSWNPVAEIELPKRTEDLREPLTLAEVERVLAVPDVNTHDGLRDRTILELLYATGLRRLELTNLILTDLDRERGTLHVRLGKTKKDRFIPVGERALAWIAKYERESRPFQVRDRAVQHLFLNQYGQPLSADGLCYRVREFFKLAGIQKRGACHLFRHTMATAMLDNGADIRHVQEMLGHAVIASTQRYTHVSIAKLKAVHAATHPAAHLLRRDCDAFKLDPET